MPPFPSFLINRFTFDSDLRAHNAANGVTFRPGRAIALELGGKGRLHRVIVEDEEKHEDELHCRWLVDATGRNRMLGKLLGLHSRPQLQKDVYWFRLVDFDPSILSRIHAIKKENHAFDSYYCTHHFFGKGNWIWCIPLVSEDHQTMISIGITYRKDIYPHEIRSVEQFLDHVGSEHPVVVDLITSGRIADTNFYGSYMYETRQHYSPDGWFIIGDAGDTVDPLYSHGLALISFQVKQIGEVVSRENSGEPVDEFVRDLDVAFTNAHRLATGEITSLYEVMHDGFRCHLRMHLAILLLFHVATPVTFSGYLWDPFGTKLFNRLLDRTAIASELARWKRLIDAVGAIPRNRSLDNYLKVQSPFSLNYKFFEHLREEDIPGSIAEMCFYLAGLRLKLLRKTGWRGFLAFDQQLGMFRDLARTAVIETFFHRRRILNSKLLRYLLATFGSGPFGVSAGDPGARVGVSARVAKGGGFVA